MFPAAFPIERTYDQRRLDQQSRFGRKDDNTETHIVRDPFLRLSHLPDHVETLKILRNQVEKSFVGRLRRGRGKISEGVEESIKVDLKAL